MPASARQLPSFLSGLLDVVFSEVLDTRVESQLDFLDSPSLGDGDKLNRRGVSTSLDASSLNLLCDAGDGVDDWRP